MSSYGQGVQMINAATSYVLKHAQIAQEKFLLTDAALSLVLERVANAERDLATGGSNTAMNRLGVMPTKRAVTE